MGFFRRLEALTSTNKNTGEVAPSIEYTAGQSVWVERPGFPAIKGVVVRITESGDVEVMSSSADKFSPEAKGIPVPKKTLDVWQHRNK